MKGCVWSTNADYTICPETSPHNLIFYAFSSHCSTYVSFTFTFSTVTWLFCFGPNIAFYCHTRRRGRVQAAAVPDVSAAAWSGTCCAPRMFLGHQLILPTF